MNSLVVADAGVYLTPPLQEPLAPQATALLRLWEQTHTRLAAPVLIWYEFAATFRKAVRTDRLTQEEADIGLRLLLTRPIEDEVDEQLVTRAFQIATQFGMPTTYDAQYLALRERLDCPFWTADKRLFNTADGHIPNVHYLGNFKPPQP